ncbi:MAG: hypothetical protein GKC53_04495 [Neisseriaceae bacterium]|nr:MAG: hypothetical protein GKC53_04495 [Neisseriaceae bacterium]
MLDFKLLDYLKALDLEPLYIHKESSTSPIVVPNKQERLSPEPVKKTNMPNQLIVTNNPDINQPQTIMEKTSIDNISELEINARAQFILANQNEHLILIGFMSSNLNQTQSPFKEGSYSKLLKHLFKQLNLTYHDETLFKKRELNQLRNKEKIRAILLFSKEFNSTKHIVELLQKNTPTKILDHPNNLLRNPSLKKQVWLELKKFFKNLN